MRTLRALAIALVVTLGLAACSGGDDGSSSGKTPKGSTTTSPGASTTTSPATPGSTPGSTAPGSASAESFVGLKKQAAIAKAENEGRVWRIGREDDEQFALTQDYIESRVTFEIDDGTVTKATFG